MGYSGQADKVLGIETAKYAKICYVLVLIAAGYGVIAKLIGLVGINMSGGLILGLLGLIGMALAATALIGFKEKFSELDVSHFIFLLAIFVLSFALLYLLGSLFMGMGAIGNIIMFIFSALQFAVLFAGFQIWKQGQIANKDNLINGMKNITSRFKS